MDGADSDLFLYFKVLMAKGLSILSRPESLNKIKALLTICEKFSNLECFKKFKMAKFLKRFQASLNPAEVGRGSNGSDWSTFSG